MNNFSKKIALLKNWNPPDDLLKIKTIEAHSAGEPLRIIIDGFPELKGKSILEKRTYAMNNYDELRRALMWEPRGHADMYGCLLLPPTSSEADFGVLFLHNEGFSTMCGHAILTLTKVVVELGLIKKSTPETEVKFDTPAGLVTAFARVNTDGEITGVYFHNVPSFVLLLDETIKVQEIGEIHFDLAFGGAFYAFVQTEELGIELLPENYRELIEKGMKIKRAIMNDYPIQHPFDNDLGFLYGTIFVGKPLTNGADSRNVCIFAEGEVDRCPTGTGVSARMAIHYQRGEIELNEKMVIESIINTKYSGSVIEETTFGPYKAIIPRIEGNAYITGKSEFIIDTQDPLKDGFILR